MIIEADKRLINVQEYYKMAEAGILSPTDRVELIHGEILNMSPVGSKHAAVVNRLTGMLNQIFSGQYVISVRNPVELSSENEPEPDISILEYRSDFYATSHPGAEDVHCLIEVAGTSLKYDREVKMPLYASHNIPCYWIIDVEHDRIEVYEKPSQSTYLNKTTFHIGQEVPLMESSLKVEDLLVFK